MAAASQLVAHDRCKGHGGKDDDRRSMKKKRVAERMLFIVLALFDTCIYN
jgi:hypothetical protein